MASNLNSAIDVKSDVLQAPPKDLDKLTRRYLPSGLFLVTAAGIAALAGFGRAITTARKQDQKLYETATREQALLLEGGTRLATRALAWGTFYAFLGTGLFCYGFWKLSGAKDMRDFRMKMGSSLPRLTKDGPPASRTEFDGLNDLMEYLSAWGK